MPVEFKDYYQTLGVPRDATDDQIKKAFRKLARLYHPDVAQDKSTAESKFKEINEAYDVLSDPAKRKKYDTLGANWNRPEGFQPPPGGGGQQRWTSPGGSEAHQFHFDGTGYSDFFEQFFGGGGFEQAFGGGQKPGGFDSGARGGRGFAMRGADIEGDIMVTLEEAMHGSVRSISLQRVNAQTGQAETQTFKVRIPVGVQEGQIIRIPGKGGEGAGGGPSGDLYLRVRLAAHPDLRPRGADLYHDLDLPPWDAVLGTTVAVPTLKEPVTVRIPPGANNGQKLRVRGRGLPKGSSGQHGDLYVVVTVELPSEVSDEERALWEKLRQTSKSRSSS